MADTGAAFQLTIRDFNLFTLGIALSVTPTKRLANQVSHNANAPTGRVRKDNIEKLIGCVGGVGSRRGKTRKAASPF